MIARLVVILAAMSCLASSPPALAAPLPAQAEPAPRTKLEAFQGRTGAVIVKGYSSIGRVSALGTVEVSAMEFTDAGTGIKQSGVLIEVTESGRLETSNRSFIDYDEVEALLGGLDYITRSTGSVTKLSDFEATYKTKGDFRATTFSSGGKVDAAVRCGYVASATAYLSLQQLQEVRALVAGAKVKLDSAK